MTRSMTAEAVDWAAPILARRLLCIAVLLAVGCTSSSNLQDEAEARARATRACARLSFCFDFDGFPGVGPFPATGGFEACRGAVSTGAWRGGLAFLDEPPEYSFVLGPGEEVIACAAAATSCEEAGRCINAGRSAGACEGPATCDGTILRDCLGGVTVATDCRIANLDCFVKPNGIAECGRSAVCPTRTTECRDGHSVACQDNIENSIPCPDGCVVFEGEAICADTSGPACDSDSVARCEGNTAVNCRFGFEVASTCANQSTCSVDSGGAFCISPEQSCRTSNCSGDVLNACYGGGESVSVDCRSVGARTCQENDDGVFGARCVP